MSQADVINAAMTAAIEETIKDLTLEATANLIAACPVDTGHARANIIPSVGAPIVVEDSGAAQAIGSAAVSSYKLTDGDVWITSSIPYIGPLLTGHSSQAAEGWDLVAIEAAVATVQAAHDSVTIDVGITPAKQPTLRVRAP